MWEFLCAECCTSYPHKPSQNLSKGSRNRFKESESGFSRKSKLRIGMPGGKGKEQIQDDLIVR
jgi:hypothetical protein